MTYWAYEFQSERWMEDLRLALNEIGPWEWHEGDSAWYGDYLSTRPILGAAARVRIHTKGNKRYTSLLQTGPDGAIDYPTMDATFRNMLARVGIPELTSIEPYD